MKATALCLSALLLTGVQANAAGIDESALEEALGGDHRPESNAARDEYRHPLDTLTFFGIEPDDTVVESWPGGGWYTQVLAPYLKDDGKLIAAEPDARDSYHQMLDASPEAYGEVERVNLGEGEAMAEPGSVDAVLDFRNAHNWIGSPERSGPLLEAWHEALKPGGIVGIVDHRRDPDGPQTRGYITEQQVIDIMDEHGFRLLGRSDVNANPDDPKDHPRGVWTLPPTLALGDQDRDKYLEIGESDRMTLMFGKK